MSSNIQNLGRVSYTAGDYPSQGPTSPFPSTNTKDVTSRIPNSSSQPAIRYQYKRRDSIYIPAEIIECMRNPILSDAEKQRQIDQDRPDLSPGSRNSLDVLIRFRQKEERLSKSSEG